MLVCTLLHAQEMPQQVRHDLSEHRGLLFAARVHAMQEQLGSAFSTEEFLKQLEAALQKKAVSQPASLAEALAASLREDGLETRDFDTALIMERLRKMLAELPKMKDSALEKQLMEQREKLDKQVIPVLQTREAAKEKRVLELNAKRPGVTTLPNGIQMEVQPGQGSIRGVNRIMIEAGISEPERTTTQCSVDDLPEAVRRMLDLCHKAGIMVACHLSGCAGSAWTFWIPAEVTDAIANEGVESQEDKQGREELLDQLAGGTRRMSLNANLNQLEKQREADDTFPVSRTQLQKITVWQDAANAPIRPFSHPTQTQSRS